MIRTLIWNIFLVASPFLLYWGYISFVAHKKEERGGKWNEAPLALLLITGVALALASLVYLALTSGDDPGSAYRPAQYEDGKLIPGSVIPPSNPEAEPDG